MSCLDTLPPSAAQGVVIQANIPDPDRTSLDQHVDEIRRLIVEAGRTPVERDTLYHEVVRENGTRWKKGRRLVALA